MLSRSEGFMLYGKLGVDLFSISEMLYPNMKFRLGLIRARPKYHVISDNPNVSLGIIECSLHTRRIALNDDCHKKTEMPVYNPVDSKFLETLAKISINPPDKTSSIKKTFLTMLQFVELSLH